jgi:hypothetical protein
MLSRLPSPGRGLRQFDARAAGKSGSKEKSPQVIEIPETRKELPTYWVLIEVEPVWLKWDLVLSRRAQNLHKTGGRASPERFDQSPKLPAGLLIASRHASRLMTRSRKTRGIRLKRHSKTRPFTFAILQTTKPEGLGRGLNCFFNDWVERFGPIKNCEVCIRQEMITKMRRDARRLRARCRRQLTRSDSFPVISRHLIRQATTAHLSTI